MYNISITLFYIFRYYFYNNDRHYSIIYFVFTYLYYNSLIIVYIISFFYLQSVKMRYCSENNLILIW